MRIAVIGVLLGLGLAAPAWAQPAGGAPAGQVEHRPPPAVEPPRAQSHEPLTPAEIRALLDAARETAKATRESVDYARVVPDLLSQILAKLDKLEDKIDKVENAIKAQRGRR